VTGFPFRSLFPLLFVLCISQYVDLDYQGGGIGEYQYWDTHYKKWNTNSCNFAGNGNNKHRGRRDLGGNNNNNNNNNNNEPRCAKMDCHLDDTHWSLLGIFKHQSYDDWMEQLFKHEGYCVWTSDEYSFMSSARKAWPSGCSDAGYTATVPAQDSEEEDMTYPIYYDIKPTTNGGMTVGLYIDTRCVQEYRPYAKDDPTTVENVLGNVLLNGGSGDRNRNNNNNNNKNNNNYSSETFEESLAEWDSGFAKWKVCQPCSAYDIENVGCDSDDDSTRGSHCDSDDDGGYYAGGDNFDCYDAAGYTNVNQVRVVIASVIGLLPKSCAGKGYTHTHTHTHKVMTASLTGRRCSIFHFCASPLLVHEIHGQDDHERCHLS
jgi:hypothetical protein